jgi:hypothetical protein
MAERMQPGNVILETLRELKPVPTPGSITSREIVRRAIDFEDPPRIPYLFMFNPPAADLIYIAPLSITGSASGQRGRLAVGDTYQDRWGVTWEVTGRYWDHAVGHPLADLRSLDGYQPPDQMTGLGLIRAAARLAHALGKYVIGLNPVGMYETMRALMGFEALMMAPYEQPERLHQLLEMLTAETLAVVDAYAAFGSVDAVLTAEDWGLQTSLQMNIRTFRKFYRPYYQRIIDRIHEYGMHFMWHNCGQILDMLPDMVEMGVDVVQLDQPRLMGHEALMAAVGGKLCLWNCVDIQWATAEGRTDQEIRDEIRRMIAVYAPARRGGGFIAKHYPQPWDIGLTPRRQRLICETFLENGCR